MQRVQQIQLSLDSITHDLIQKFKLYFLRELILFGTEVTSSWVVEKGVGVELLTCMFLFGVFGKRVTD